MLLLRVLLLPLVINICNAQYYYRPRYPYYPYYGPGMRPYYRHSYNAGPYADYQLAYDGNGEDEDLDIENDELRRQMEEYSEIANDGFNSEESHDLNSTSSEVTADISHHHHNRRNRWGGGRPQVQATASVAVVQPQRRVRCPHSCPPNTDCSCDFRGQNCFWNCPIGRPNCNLCPANTPQRERRCFRRCPRRLPNCRLCQPNRCFRRCPAGRPNCRLCNPRRCFQKCPAGRPNCRLCNPNRCFQRCPAGRPNCRLCNPKPSKPQGNPCKCHIGKGTSKGCNRAPIHPQGLLRSCPPGYMQLNLGTRCYRLYTNKVSFDQAFQTCNRDCAILAEPRTQAEHDVLVKKWGDDIEWAGQDFWLGIRSAPNGGGYRYASDNSNVFTTFFLPGLGGGARGCVLFTYIRKDAKPPGPGWKVFNCFQPQQFVCQVNV